jgi:hypothetical protein
MNNGSFLPILKIGAVLEALFLHPFTAAPSNLCSYGFLEQCCLKNICGTSKKRRKRNKKNLLIIVMYNYLSLYLFSIIYGCFMDKAYMCIAFGRWETEITKQGLRMSPLKIAHKNIFWGD